MSSVVLQQLLDSQCDICAIFVARISQNFAPVQPTSNATVIPLISANQEPTLEQIAWANRIPIHYVGSTDAQAHQKSLTAAAPDIACVACFPFRIPRSVLEIPHHGFLNVHPSLLPHYRGPEPIYWMLHNGELEQYGGVTIHWLDEGWDTGDIAEQRALRFPRGATEQHVEIACARNGGNLLVDVLKRIGAGEQERHPQPAGGSYFSVRQESLSSDADPRLR